jgi:N-acetylmuramoyl-L-alanine amidase
MRLYLHTIKLNPLFIVFAVILACFVAFSSPVLGSVLLKLENDSKSIEPISSDPVILLPLHEVASCYGVDSQWSVAQEQMALSKDGICVRLTLGNPYALVNGSKLKILSTPPVILCGTVVLPPQDTATILSELFPSLNLTYNEAKATIEMSKVDSTPQSGISASPFKPKTRNSSFDDVSDFPGNFDLKTVVIDPGHGGHDSGASRAGVREKDIVLDVSLRLAELLRTKTDLKVVLTRDTDRFIRLSERTDIANRYPADSTLFLCIHCNAAPSKSGGRGTETYVFNLEATDNEAKALASRENEGEPMDLTIILSHCYHAGTEPYSQDIARRALNTLTDELGLSNRGVRHAAFFVLAGTKMPATLVELAYVSNSSERAKLQSASFRQKAAEALFDSIMSFKWSVSKSLAKNKTSGETNNP